MLDSSDDERHDTPIKTTKRKRGVITTPITPQRRSFFAGSIERQQRQRSIGFDELSSEDLSDGGVCPLPSTKRHKSQSAVVASSEDDTFAHHKVRSSPLASRSRRKRNPIRYVSSEELEYMEDDAVFPANFRKGKGKKSGPCHIGSQDDDSDDDPIVSPQRTTRLRQFSPVARSGSNGSNLKSPKTTATAGRSRVIMDDDDDESSDESIVSPIRTQRLKRGSQNAETKASNESSGSSAEDIREDVKDLRDSKVIEQRTRGKPAASNRSSRQQQLQKLKQRRAKYRAPSEEKPDGSDDDDPHQSRREKEPISMLSDDEEAVVVSGQSDAGNSLDDLDSEDEEEDDFVVSDPEAPLGAPADLLNDVPIQFTRYAHMKPIEYFKHVVEWMVHNKLNPAFSRYDAMYQLALQKLDLEVKALMGSKFMSSVWTLSFVKTLQSKPELFTLDIPTMLDHKCGACNRSKHPPTQSLSFQGKPYDPKSLENLSDGSDSDSDSDSNTASASNSNSEAGAERTFHVGRVCSANASTAHALHHWRYHLNQYILQWLSAQGHMSAKKILEREKWSQRRKEAFANEVVDGMVEDGEMKRLYKEFKENLEAARDARTDGLVGRFLEEGR